MLRSPLPIRAGVSASRLYLPKESWPNLLAFLIQRFPHMSAAIIQERLARGDMVSQAGEVLRVDSPYLPDSWLWYYREVEQEVRVPDEIAVLYQDETLVVIDKPHFLASIPGGRYLQETALVRLRCLLGNEDISPIHRLDRDTAGLLLFCADKRYRGAYQSLFQSRDVHKTYECVAPYRADLAFPLRRESFIEKSPSYFTMQEGAGARAVELAEIAGEPEAIVGEYVDMAGEKERLLQPLNSPAQEWVARVSQMQTVVAHKAMMPNSRTDISIIKHNQEWAHYLLEPYTGKKHQLRVHMNALGLPIMGDKFYPELLPARAVDDFSRPLQLLAREIRFKDPVTGQERVFRSRRELEGVVALIA